MLSRVIATCDAFVAIASDRPHRRGIGPEAALARVCQERGSQLDPQIVDALVAAFASERKPVPAARRASSAEVVPTAGSDVRQEPAGRRGLVRDRQSSASFPRSLPLTSAYSLPPEPMASVAVSS